MSTKPPLDSAPDAPDRKKLGGVGVLLAFLFALVVLALVGLGLWGSGGMPANP